MPVIGTRPTLNVEHILMATDFSDASRVAGAYAMALGLRFGSAIDAVHIYDPAQNRTYEDGKLAPLDGTRIEMRQERLQIIERKMLSLGLDAHAIHAEGHPAAKKLLSLIEERHADLIVLGTSCRTGIDRLLLGSTAEAVLRETCHPVLTVGPQCEPPACGPLAFHRIVYATDFSPQAARAAAFALSFAEDSAAEIYYSYVAGSDEELTLEQEASFRAELKRLVPDCSAEWCTPHTVVAHGEPVEAILELAERVGADLIVLGARRSTFALRHLERGVTPQVLAEAKCPVLTVC
ncbi:Nucleotide-binding universal stress protein, UspA family [Bryocella elongata]|uniref:Nucleotide-binding universal stress protein, UspA family n=1 Tax=Bryocella elongata TaxID=863522 RepID=A0A1H5VYC7_9BACT|nr:universal stress protein [Bryocella elongata]SEF91996.1 Nucleotide-binding universal stress protein, UspA family [Bryocella elongata]